MMCTFALRRKTALLCLVNSERLTLMYRLTTEERILSSNVIRQEHELVERSGT